LRLNLEPLAAGGWFLDTGFCPGAETLAPSLIINGWRTAEDEDE
jgi:hypothetical protein